MTAGCTHDSWGEWRIRGRKYTVICFRCGLVWYVLKNASEIPQEWNWFIAPVPPKRNSKPSRRR